MIHVCQIDIGYRYVFDMQLGIDDVLTLKQAIEKQSNVPFNDQILLVSGGVVLQNVKQKICGLSAGIEESPIYLIDLHNVKSFAQKQQNVQVQQQQHLNSFIDMSKEIDDAIKLLEPSYQTVLQRTQLANKVFENDSNLHKLCEQYYMDQYWQYQGFMALIANLDDLITSIEKMFERTKEHFMSYNENKINNLNNLKEIEKFIKQLSDINLLPELNEYATKNLTLFQSICSQLPLPFSSSISSSSIITTNDSPSSSFNQSNHHDEISSINLLEWTNSTDPRHKLETVLSKAKDSFECLDMKWWTQIETDIQNILNEGNNQHMKEIEGLTKRLSDLNAFLEACKKSLSSEKEICDSFKTNLNRATTLKDPSILHDLCVGHEGALKLLSQNHLKIVDITKRVCKAKYELTKVINSRLNWVMNVQKQLISSLNSKLIICNEKIKQSNLHMKQVEQIRNAPTVYFQALNETIRREKFSVLYKEFSSELFTMINEITKQEIKRRELFSQKFSRNYLANLFPYLNDQLQTFLKPELNLNFDLNIPKLDEHSVKQVESDFKAKHVYEEKSREESDRELKYLEFITRKIKNDIKVLKDEFNEEDDNVLVQKENTTDTSAIFLSKLTDTPIANSDNDEQLILVNKKPSANKEFLDKLTDILKREISDLRENLDILRENYESIKSENKKSENFVLSLEQMILNEKLKKKKFYKKLIENLFSTINNNQQVGDREVDQDVDDQEFYKDLKDNLIKLRETYDRTVEDTRKSMDSLKINFLADKQKHFNEAIEHVSREKDRQIEELKQIQIKQSNEIAELKQKLANESDREEAFQRSLMKQQKLIERNQFLEQQLNKSNNRTSASTSTIITQQPSPMLDNSVHVPQNPSNNRHQPLSNVLQLNCCSIGDLVLVIYDFSHCAYKIAYQHSPYTHFVHTDSIKIFDSNSQIYKEFINSNSGDIDELAQLDSILPSSPSSPSNLDETFAAVHFNKETIQNLIGRTIYNNGSNMIPSSSKLETSTSTLTSSCMNNLASSVILNTNNSNINKPLWFIGRVVHKEFCIARKANNRYRVPSGTQFYRVRIYPFKI